MNQNPDSRVSIPKARRIEKTRELHGDLRVDGYDWLRNVADPDVLAHLTAERSYYDASTAHLRPLVDSLASDMAARVPETDSGVSFERSRFAYYTRTPAGSEYEQLWRGSSIRGPGEGGTGSGDQLLLDPATLKGGSAYVQVGVSLVSPDERRLAYSVDTTGDEVYALRFRDLEPASPGEQPHDLDDEILRSYYGGAWSADSQTFFYTVHDEAFRPYQVWRHRVGTPASTDVLVLSEDDEQYDLDVRGTRSGDLVVIDAANRDTSEVWLVDAHRPEEPPRCVEPRRRRVEYACEHVRTPTGDRLLIVTNDGAPEFRMMSAPLSAPDRDRWVEVLPEDPAERLYDVTAFAGHVVSTLRRDAVLMARSYRITAEGGLAEPVDIAPSFPAGTLEPAHNELFEATELQVVEESWTHPKAWYGVDLVTAERRPLMTQDVPAYDVAKYVTERRYAPSGDVQIPVTVVRHVDTPLDGSAPCLLYGYGAYEACFDPEFDAALTVLLDHGVVWVHAGIRGGGEGGRRWWLDGHLARKQNTFTDHVAVASFLSDGLVDGSRIVTRGLSAGGMLQGAVFSQAPSWWAGVIAEVPAVDILTTMLDPSIPLTVTEYDEWGDPRKEVEYWWLRGYSPYDNIPPAGVRPDLLVTGALHDPRVMVWEPTKWVAELRHTDPHWSPRCRYRVELGEGAHAGPSGRYAHLRYEAEIDAWALERFGLA
ncbi:MAG: prolyl oligopeptidase family serine peptidase [Nocardioidaceae bacterium]